MISRVFAAALVLATSADALAGEFDQHVKACHDAVWALDEFKLIPNAGVSAYLGGYGDSTFYAYWIIDWDDVQVAGKCSMERKSPKILQLTDFRKK